jgi:hypothetical protein
LILCVKLIQPHDVVGATHWPKLRTGARKGAEGNTVTRCRPPTFGAEPTLWRDTEGQHKVTYQIRQKNGGQARAVGSMNRL